MLTPSSWVADPYCCSSNQPTITHTPPHLGYDGMLFKTTDVCYIQLVVNLWSPPNSNSTLKLCDLKCTAAVTKWAPCCQAGVKQDTTAAGLVQFGLLPLALQDADTTPSVQHNQPDVLFYPPSPCGHTQPSAAGSTAVKVHPSLRINPPSSSDYYQLRTAQS